MHYISDMTVIYPLAELGDNCLVEPFCILGKPVDSVSQVKKTQIGDSARIRSHTVVYENVSIGSNFSTGHHVTIRDNTRIGDSVSIGTASTIEHDVIMKNNSRVHSNVFIPEYTFIGENVWIGPQTTFTNAKYPNNMYTKEKLSGVYVEDGVIIGANVTILPGVRIAKDSVIGAGSVVTKDTKSGWIYIGSPARRHVKKEDIRDYEET